MSAVCFSRSALAWVVLGSAISRVAAAAHESIVSSQGKVPTQDFCTNYDPNNPICVRTYLFSASKQPYAKLGIRPYGYIVNGAGYGQYGYGNAYKTGYSDYDVNVTDANLQTTSMRFKHATFWNNSYGNAFIAINDQNSDSTVHNYVGFQAVGNPYAGQISFVNLLDDGSTFYFSDYDTVCKPVAALQFDKQLYFTSTSGVTSSPIELYATSTCGSTKQKMTCTVYAGGLYYIAVYGTTASKLTSAQISSTDGWCVVETSSSSKGPSITIIIILVVVFGGLGFFLAVALVWAELRKRQLGFGDEEEETDKKTDKPVVAQSAPIPAGFELVNGTLIKISDASAPGMDESKDPEAVTSPRRRSPRRTRRA